MNLGAPEILIIAVIILVVFGGSGLNKVARNLGRAKVEVEKAQKTYQETLESSGLKEADAALKKMNRTLNQSPQALMKQAAKGAVTPKATDAAALAAAAGVDGVTSPGETAEAAIADLPETDEPAAEPVADEPASSADAGEASNITIDFDDDV